MTQVEHAEMYKQIYGFEENIPKPNGWIQWKGTEVCIDIHCECGQDSHFDGEFAYAIRCPSCSKVFALAQTIRLIELREEYQKHFNIKELEASE